MLFDNKRIPYLLVKNDFCSTYLPIFNYERSAERERFMTRKMDDIELETSKNEQRTAFASVSQLLSVDFEISIEYLERKFSWSQRSLEDITYELTADPGYLHQYYLLREQMFIHVWGLQNFTGQKDEYDDSSDIMVARIGNHVIGGCRLTFSTRENNKLLPMEKRDFLLSEELPELSLTNETYVEISRMAILPEYQNSVALLELSRQLLRRGAERHARYAFTLAPTSLARNYRKAASLFGLKWQIRHDVSVPTRKEYEGIRMTLSMLDLAPIYKHIMASKQSHIEAL